MKKKFIVDIELYKLEVDKFRVVSYCLECVILFDGFKYLSYDENRKVDVWCFFFFELFVYVGYLYLLYFRKVYYRRFICDVCMKMSNFCFMFDCEDCWFNLCFFCVILFLRIWYRMDEYFFILCCDKKVGG